MRALLAIARETFLRLRRDRIFIPAVISGLLLALIASVASDWGIEEFTKILFDIGMAGFHLTGGIVAVFWGAKIIADSRQEGSIEVQLASPVSRSTWLVGKFLGLCLSLIVLGVIFGLLWQGVMYFSGFGIMTTKHLTIVAMIMFVWLILGAVAVCFSSFTSQPVALFASLCLWAAGLTAAPIQQALAPTTPETTKAALGFFAKIWNLQRFNLGEFASRDVFPSAHELGMSVSYGVFVVGFLLSVACLAFRRRDLIG